MKAILNNNPQQSRREGKILVLVAITLPALMSVVSVLVNSMYGFKQSLDLQHACDSAALAAAIVVRDGVGNVNTAASSVLAKNGLSSGITMTVNKPPVKGPYTGNQSFVEVVLSSTRPMFFSSFLTNNSDMKYEVRSVAGIEAATSLAALHILDEDPAQLSVLGISGILPSVPALLAGLEVEGLGAARIQGSVIVNTRWSGEDQNGDRVGIHADLPMLQHAVSCTPILPLTRLRCEDLWVNGGVDERTAYKPLTGTTTPLVANQYPVKDPFIDLPVPTTAVDPANVNLTYRGSVTIVSLPILAPPVVLNPGIYDSINIVAGRVVFNPGIYIIRSVNLVAGAALVITAGEIKADGVMFYITNNATYNGISGGADATDAANPPSNPGVLSLLPSVIINAALLNSSFTGLNAPNSPYNGMLIFQRRNDRRPIVILKQELLLSDSDFSGQIYAKWGHVILSGQGTFKTAIAAGTMRFIAVDQITIAPPKLLPAARAISLVE